ncbi:unnamed protein product, partial [Mesorhabditis belari]|uniref:Uncharacterized protein n=1 Tax=Mesorhabditis belari TaxID=2138241 RepID=A0AAF3F4E5_9BILA
MGDDEEKEQLKHDVANLRQQVRMLNEHIESYEKEAPSSSTPSNSHEKEKLMAEISSLKAFQIAHEEEHEAWLKKLQDVEKRNQELTEQNKELESLLCVNEVSDHETTQHNLEINKYKQQLDDLEAEAQANYQTVRDLRMSLATKEDQLHERNGEYERVFGELGELRLQIKVLKSENEELEAGINQATSLPFASRGNSMFGEFADERRNLEQDMKKLHVELTKYKKENRMLKIELEDAKLRSTAKFESGPRRDCKCRTMEIELINLRQNIASLEQRSILFLRENLQRLQNPEKIRFYGAEIQRMEDTVTHLRKERDEAKDRLIIEQAKCESASIENAALKAQVDDLRLHINEQQKRFEDMMNEETRDEIAEVVPAPVKEIATTSHFITPCKAPENTGMVTPLSIATAKTKQYELNSDLQVDKEEMRRKIEKDRREAESEKLTKLAEGFKNRNVMKRNNSMLTPVVTTQENKKAKLAIAPKPMLSNFQPFVIQSPAKKVEKENERH